MIELFVKEYVSRFENGRDDTRLIPPRQVSLKLNHYNKIENFIINSKNTPQNLVVTCTNLKSIAID